MRKMLRGGFLMAGLAFAMTVAAVAGSPESKSSEESKSKSSEESLKSLSEASKARTRLLQEGEALKSEVTELDYSVSDLRAMQSSVARMKSDKQRAERDLKAADERLKQAPQSQKASATAYVSDIKRYLANIEQDLAMTETRLKESPNLETQLKAKRAEQAAKSTELAAVERRIDDILNIERPRQSFKVTMSIVFAALVGLVILGFFYVAIKDSSISRTIFAGTAGIQFVTLFSVVIAIILFGIIDILESRELSALLGGLSGYILGRATTERGSTVPPSPPPPADRAGSPPPPAAAQG